MALCKTSNRLAARKKRSSISLAFAWTAGSLLLTNSIFRASGTCFRQGTSRIM
jgi:hypothetical protein